MWQIIGQEKAVSLLQRGLASGLLSHAYLFVGPEHIGKMTLAKRLAQALNCESEEKPCLACPACKKIEAGRHADVQVIGLMMKEDDSEAKVIGIKQIEDMQHMASLPPFEGRHKVFIFENAELLSIEAANRFLKTLEEPEKNVTFILLTTNDKLLPATVISRCQRLEMPPLPIAGEAAALAERGIEPERARLLAGLSAGRPGWAIIAADNNDILEKRAEELDRLQGIIRADCEERFALAAQLASRFTQDRSAVYDVLDLWLDYWRDIMLVKLGICDMIINGDRKEELTALAAGFSIDRIKAAMDSIQAAGTHLRQNANTRLALEVLMLDIPAGEGG